MVNQQLAQILSKWNNMYMFNSLNDQHLEGNGDDLEQQRKTYQNANSRISEYVVATPLEEVQQDSSTTRIQKNTEILQESWDNIAENEEAEESLLKDLEKESDETRVDIVQLTIKTEQNRTKLLKWSEKTKPNL